jgi:hypothetical protein
MNPKALVKSETTFSKQVCPLLYTNVREGVNKILTDNLPSVQGAHCTTNHWTSRSNDAYQALTLRNRPKPRLTQEQEESAVDDPQPGTSTQSQSLIQTPKTPKTTRSPGVRTKTTPTRIRFMPPVSDSESESD